MINRARAQVEAGEPSVVTLCCPHCGAPAAVEWTAQLASTDGAVPHVKVRCLDRHWFLLPADMLRARLAYAP